jgi:crotonobetainyl-CoA:carnitine CoA-transferase CaiB-like acyl-CoA transferase
VAQALSGFLGVVVDPDRPRFLGPALADAITGIYAAYGILGALLERTRTHTGRHVEVSMLEAMAHFAVEPFAAFFALGVNPKSSDRPRLAQAYILQTADNQLIAIHLSSLEKFWSGLISATEADHLNGDERFATRLLRIDNYEALGEQLNAIFRRRSLSEWAERLNRYDVPFAPINNIESVVADPQVRHLGLVVPVEARSDGGKFAVRPALQFDSSRADSVSAAPLLNQHGEAIRMALAASKEWPAAKWPFVASAVAG